MIKKKGCIAVTEALSWTIKTAREIYTISFSFVTISYRQYNICMCRTLLSGVYYTAQLLDVALESFAVNGTAFYCRAIVVDGARSIE